MEKVFCPIYEKITNCQKLNEYSIDIRGENITIPVNMYKCKECGEIFNEDLGIDIFDLAYREYRKRH